MEEARNVLRLANRSKSVDLTVARDEGEEHVSCWLPHSLTD